MARGRKTGGRIKGTPNRATQDFRELLQDLDCDPVAGVAGIAMDRANPPELRFKAYAELIPYVYPKRRQLEVTADVDAYAVCLPDEAALRERFEAILARRAPAVDPGPPPATQASAVPVSQQRPVEAAPIPVSPARPPAADRTRLRLDEFTDGHRVALEPDY